MTDDSSSNGGASSHSVPLAPISSPNSSVSPLITRKMSTSAASLLDTRQSRTRSDSLDDKGEKSGNNDAPARLLDSAYRGYKSSEFEVDTLDAQSKEEALLEVPERPPLQPEVIAEEKLQDLDQKRNDAVHPTVSTAAKQRFAEMLQQRTSFDAAEVRCLVTVSSDDLPLHMPPKARRRTRAASIRYAGDLFEGYNSSDFSVSDVSSSSSDSFDM